MVRNLANFKFSIGNPPGTFGSGILSVVGRSLPYCEVSDVEKYTIFSNIKVSRRLNIR